MIYARSPYIVHVDDVGLEDIEFKITCYNGTSTTDRATGTTYEFAIDAINGEVTFDVSPYIREFLEVDSVQNPFSTGAFICWVYMEIDKDTGAGLSGSFTQYKTDTIASLGYTYFEDLKNNEAEPAQLITSANYIAGSTNQALIKGANVTFRIPVFKTEQLAANDYRVYSYSGPNATGSLLGSPLVTQTTPSELDDQIQYVTLPIGVRSFQYRDTASADVTLYDVYEVSDCPNGVTSIFFLNRYGVVEEIQFFGRLVESHTIDGNSYKKTILSSGDWSVYDRQITEINKRSRRRFQISSGLYPENYNEQFKQLLLSTRVWLVEFKNRDGAGGTTSVDKIPVSITDNDITYKYGKYDKKIEYTLTFELANSEIQDVA